MNYSIQEIAHIIKAEYQHLTDSNISVLLTDSRSLTFPEESLFFALVTQRNDGHRYIFGLYKQGVRNFVVSHTSPEIQKLPDINLLFVPNTMQALQQLASLHRKKFDRPVVGISGSKGKTIVKEWLYQLLQSDYNVVRSPRSYNSQIGVPLSVWQMNESTGLAIFEAGTSEVGEMDKIASVIRPKIGILTNLGDAHQGGFHSLQEKCMEKLELFKGADIIIYNGDNLLISDCDEKMCLTSREIAWSKTDRESPLYISKIEKHDTYTEIEYSYLRYINRFKIPFIEDASVENAIHCLAVLLYLGILPQVITERMEKLEPVAMRMEVKEGRNDCLIINDTYNSDINSLEIALDFLVRRSAGSDMRKTLILSDILQTGMLSSTLYRKVADVLQRKGIDRLIGIGTNISENAKIFTNIEKEFFPNTTSFLMDESIENFKHEIVLIKGSREFHFERISEELELKQHETILEVNLDAVVNNYNFYRQRLKSGTKMICMVKAFGYGAGSYEVAKTLQEHGCEYVAVAVADEGAELRKAGITMPIMVMNPEMSSFRTLFSYSLEPEIYSFKLLNAFIREAERLGVTRYPIHIKIDSGMHRLGFVKEDIPELVSILKSQPSVVPRSVFSHLAGSDNPGFDDFTRKQIAVFTECADALQEASSQRVLRHILNTAGIYRFPEAQMDIVRLGIGLYGIPCAGEEGLRNVSTLKTTILQIKELPAGETVGYSRKGVLTRDSRIAAIPIGYADGFDRHLGNGVGHVVIKGKKAPVVGNICMDVCMVDVTDIACEEGDKVEIFGDNQPVTEISDLLGTIPYEVLASISARVKRVYFRE